MVSVAPPRETKKTAKEKLRQSGGLSSLRSQIQNFAPPPHGGFAFIEYKIEPVGLSGTFYDARQAK